MKFLHAFEESENGFRNIAQVLFDKYAIRTEGGEYRLVDIEFYWHSPTHQDKSTYDRRHVNPKTGEWLFHFSGVDIALRNEEGKGYGGILIRGIYDPSKDKCIEGPLVCGMMLFSGHDAFSGETATRLVSCQFPSAEVKTSKRKGLGKNAKYGGFSEREYRFYHRPAKPK